MSQLTLDITKTCGKVKPMHAVNNGPVAKLEANSNDNFESYKALEIPYARNHDAAFCSSYGGEHTVDVHLIFPNFDADENDPASYDFHLTDEYIGVTAAAGTETFYRLGTKIEHESKKYGTIPPRDFGKWARICEHIIRHMNMGWADGHHFGITYWEIWNEPDLGDKTWGGTKEQFFDMYEIAAKHLKKCFPDLKIGGPALAWRMEWAEEFLCEMQRRNVPIDFFSWHCYGTSAAWWSSRKYREMLDKYGYNNTESILNEWNYMKNFGPDFVPSIQVIIGMKGAAFAADVMCRLEHEPVDMLMYYDARPSIFNGLWDFYDCSKQLKTYYSMRMFSSLYRMGTEIETPKDIDGISAVAAKGADGKCGIMLCYYSDDDSCTEEKNIELNIIGGTVKSLTVSILDENNDAEESSLPVSNDVSLTLCHNTVAFVSFDV